MPKVNWSEPEPNPVRWFIQRIEWLRALAMDESQPVGDRLEAADEVLMYAGPDMTRAAARRSLSRYRLMAGCLSDETGVCRCHSPIAVVWAVLVAPVLMHEFELRIAMGVPQRGVRSGRTANMAGS